MRFRHVWPLALVASIVLVGHESGCLVDEYSCVGSDSCSIRATAAACAAVQGCFEGERCVATGCGDKTQVNCNEFGGNCLWNSATSTCDPKPDACYGPSDGPERCNQIPGCTWGMGCRGTWCGGINDEAECSRVPYCTWAKRPKLN